MMITVTVHSHPGMHTFQVEMGTNLRQALFNHGLSPYAAVTRRVNCGGRGLCATCGVWLETESPPVHWHDKIGHRFSYPRLSCQITVNENMVVHLIPEKRVWGPRKQLPGSKS